MGASSNGGIAGQGAFGSIYPAGAVDGAGFRAITYDGNQFGAYKNSTGTLIQAAGLVWQQPGTVFLFNGAGNFPTDARLGLGFVGRALNSAEIATLSAATLALEVALGRAN